MDNEQPLRVLLSVVRPAKIMGPVRLFLVLALLDHFSHSVTAIFMFRRKFRPSSAFFWTRAPRIKRAGDLPVKQVKKNKKRSFSQFVSWAERTVKNGGQFVERVGNKMGERAKEIGKAFGCPCCQNHETSSSKDRSYVYFPVPGDKESLLREKDCRLVQSSSVLPLAKGTPIIDGSPASPNRVQATAIPVAKGARLVRAGSLTSKIPFLVPKCKKMDKKMDVDLVEPSEGIFKSCANLEGEETQSAPEIFKSFGAVVSEEEDFCQSGLEQDSQLSVEARGEERAASCSDNAVREIRAVP